MAKATLVLLPGMDGTGTLFGPLLDALGDGVAHIVVSYPTGKPYGYADLESLAAAALPSAGPLVLLGESFSGPIAIELAAKRPAQVQGLILSCTFVRNPRPGMFAFNWLTGLLPARPPMALLGHVLFGRFATPELRRLLHQALDQMSPAVMRARLQAVLHADATAALARVRVPVLYLRASEDRLVPPSASARITALCPHARILAVEGPHCLLQAVPREAAKAISGFLDEIDVTQS